MARDGAGIRKATENSIQIEFTYKSKRCRERIKCAPTPANIRKIALFRETVINEIESGIFDYAKTFPDSKHATRFIEKVEYFNGHKKKDDLADSFLQGMWFINNNKI